MTREIGYKGIVWAVGYGWNDVHTDVYITGIYVQGSDVDLYNYLDGSIQEGLYEALEKAVL